MVYHMGLHPGTVVKDKDGTEWEIIKRTNPDAAGPPIYNARRMTDQTIAILPSSRIVSVVKLPEARQNELKS